MQREMAKMRDLREKLHLSQIQLAVRAGVSIGVVQKLEGPGKVEPRIAQALADALGVRPEDVDELRPSLSGAPPDRAKALGARTPGYS